MKISIAMATYNGAEYIEAQLQSFVNQTHLPDELIITDDRSTDHTVDLIQNFAARIPFKVLISVNAQNLGYAGNFNVALSHTTGDLVFLSDQDDVWFPKKIEQMIALTHRHPQKMIFMNDAELTDKALNSVHLTKYGQIKSAGLKDTSFIMGCCCAIRREFLDFTLPIPTGVKGHDNWLVSIADHLHLKVITPEVLQFYRRHESNESNILINRLAPITRWQRKITSFNTKLKRLFSPDFKRRAKKLHHASAFLDGLILHAPKVPAAYQQGFYSLIQQKKNALHRFKMRQTFKMLFSKLRWIKNQ